MRMSRSRRESARTHKGGRWSRCIHRGTGHAARSERQPREWLRSSCRCGRRRAGYGVGLPGGSSRHGRLWRVERPASPAVPDSARRRRRAQSASAASFSGQTPLRQRARSPRRSPAAMPSAEAKPWRMASAFWVPSWMVSLSPFHSATVAISSIGFWCCGGQL